MVWGMLPLPYTGMARDLTVGSIVAVNFQPMIPFLLPTLALIGVASPTVVKLLPPPRVNPNACPPVVRPPPSIPLVSSSSLSGLVAFSRANASQETFVFVSGNKAMNAMIQNWASSVYALAPRSFSFVAVPLDKEGAATLAASARVPLFYDEPALETFSPTEGLFGCVRAPFRPSHGACGAAGPAVACADGPLLRWAKGGVAERFNGSLALCSESDR